MKPNNLESLLSRIESTMTSFSFEELNSEDAADLRLSFQNFKEQLKEKVEGNVNSKKNKSNCATKEKASDLALNSSTTLKEVESRLIANVSHEIRTPLNGIIGFTDLLKETQLDDGQLDKVNAIQTASHSLLEIVNELLEYSKLAADIEQFQKLDFDLYGLIRDVIFLCNTLITNKKVTLTSDIGHDIPKFLKGDPSKLTQVLLNVIGNAIKFVEDGQVQLRITTIQEKENRIFLQFEVEDNGIGIAEDKIDSIFDSFKQAEADTFSKYGGSGLGLNIVNKIVEKLGGSVNVTSNLGVGTTFQFTMPFELGKERAIPKTLSKNKIKKDNLKKLAGLNVLVFEDNLLNQKIVQQRLESWQCEVHVTDDGQIGLDILEGKPIDVILMDLRMPQMSGFEVTRLIRSSNSQRIRKIPIIALTADYSIRDQEKCHSYGINDYLLKPFSHDELLLKLVASQNCKKEYGKVDLLPKTKRAVTEKVTIVNLDRLIKDSMRDFDLFEELILMFKQNISEFLKNTKRHIHNKNIEGVAFSAHKIKAGLAMIHANELLKIVEDIQSNCNKYSDWRNLEFLFVRFSKNYPKVELVIDDALNEMRKG